MPGREVQITHPSKVLYPATGLTKAEVIDYYTRIAPALLPHIRGRPVTRKRWPDGVAHGSFFEKNLPASAPEWLDRRTVAHKDHSATYPLIDDAEGLAWLGQQAALELHVPQWVFRGEHPGPATRLVFDLDPGEGVGLTECAAVAFAIRELLEHAGLSAFPTTSGSKGIHLYVPLPQPVSPPAALTVARKVAESLAVRMPAQVTAVMAKAERVGKVLIDWSQNNGAKTTIAPYSLRGLPEPTVSAPRSWDELAQSGLRQLRCEEALARFQASGDLLEEYLTKRDAAHTPEPMQPVPKPKAGNSFVIQEHHARRLHWDFRLERGGVLVSWALPKNLPDDPGVNHLAVHVEDHPLEYGSFEGPIPKGQYGGGQVAIWDSGTYDTVKWRDGEVIVDLHGRRARGRYALIRTDKAGDKDWLIHLMRTNPPLPRGLSPMLAAGGKIGRLDPQQWAFEGKWDGYRVLVEAAEGKVVLRSRNGHDITAEFPDLRNLGAELTGHEAVLDGELVALNPQGVPDFSLLHSAPTHLYLFDVLFLDGISLLDKPFRERRRVLEALRPLLQSAEVPDPLGPDAMAVSLERGLEGVVAKRLDSAYLPGHRSEHWVKEKHWRTDEVVIGGWTAGNGARADSFGALLLGVPGPDGLRYVGKVGAGFTDLALAALTDRLQPLRRASCPFVEDPGLEAVWVEPVLVAEVRHAGATDAGLLRHSTWRGLRPDKSPGDAAVMQE